MMESREENNAREGPNLYAMSRNHSNKDTNIAQSASWSSFIASRLSTSHCLTIEAWSLVITSLDDDVCEVSDDESVSLQDRS